MKNRTLFIQILAFVGVMFPFAPLIQAADVAFYGVIKEQTYVQESPNFVRLRSEGNESPIYFNTFVDLTGQNTITSATVQRSGGPVYSLIPDGGQNFAFHSGYDGLAKLETDFADGNYTVTINGKADGTRQVTLGLTGSTYPSAPRISNLLGAQAVNANASFTLIWDSPGMTANDFVEVRIEEADNNNTVYKSGDAGSGTGLSGISTQFTIPAGSLQPGKKYAASLMFAKIVAMDSSSYGDGVTGVAAYVKVTEFDLVTNGGSDTQQPQFYQSSPFQGETNVNVRSTIAFRFSEPMQNVEHIQWTGSGINPANFVYSWSTDETVLYATYLPSFPTSTTIGWELNPSGSTTMKDLAGNALPGGKTGQFTTSASGAASDPDVQQFDIIKMQTFVQTDSTPVADGFQAMVTSDLSSLNSIRLASLSVPGGDTLDLEGMEFGNYLDAEAGYTSKADMDRFFPSSGAYAISLTTAHDGARSVTLNLPADDYPNPPTCNNLASLQALNAANSFNIGWGAFSGATGSDLIFVEILNQYDEHIFETDGGLATSATSINIPANTLSPGRRYTVLLTFGKVKVSDTTSYSGATFIAGFAKTTQFVIQTTGSPNRPHLAAGSGAFGSFVVDSGEKRWRYQIEATTDFNLWAPLQYQIYTYDGTGYGYDQDAQFVPLRFYRVKDAPDNYVPGFVALHGTVRSSNGNTPIAGAVVGTSLDGRTATTDASGNFFLQTGIMANQSTAPYTVTVTKTGFQPFSSSQNWGDQPRNLQINLNPVN